MLTRNKKYDRTNDMLGNTYGDLTVFGFYESKYTDKGKRLPQVLCECKKGHVMIKDAADMRNTCKNKCPLCSRESTKWRMDIDIEPGKEKFEIWKPIRGYEGYYEVSNFGRVRSLDREVISALGIKRRITGYFLPQRYFENRYLVVFLSKDGKQKPYKVHHLVAEAFIPNPDHKPYINHKDGNKLYNWAGNIEWVTQKGFKYVVSTTQRVVQRRSTAENRINSRYVYDAFFILGITLRRTMFSGHIGIN